MPEPTKLSKALLQVIGWDTGNNVNHEGTRVPVQFNPETLKLTRSNQVAGADQNGGAAIQFSSRGTTKLSFELWFDVTALPPDSPPETDVRKLTQKVAAFMKAEPRKDPKGKKGKSVFVPPGTRFLWGSFLFEGVMESMNETLELFSADGKPLRANVSVSLLKQNVEVRFAKPDDPKTTGTTPAPGTEPMQQARQGDTVQDMAAREGEAENWQQIAAANDIDNPRHLPAGTPIDIRKLLATIT